MSEKNITVYIDGQPGQYPEGTLFQQIASDYQKDCPDPIMLVKADGVLNELIKTAQDGQRLSFVTIRDKAGYDTYRRSLVLLMLKAIYHEAGDNANIDRVGIYFAVGNGYYCTLEGRVSLTQAFLDRVCSYMRELVNQAAPIRKESVPTREARRRFHEYRMYDKEELFSYRRASRVNIYNLESFEDYFYGYMLPDASYLSCFDLQLFEDGFVLLFPEQNAFGTLPAFCPSRKIWQVQKDSLQWGSRLGISTVGALNSYVVSRGPKDLITTQEAFQEKKIAELATQIASVPDRRVVLIAGPSSSGKTTFSHRLATQLAVEGLKPHPIEADNYFKNREDTPRDEDGNYDFECLEALDIEKLNDDMLALLAGETVEMPTFNFMIGRREYKGNTLTLGPDDVLIIEGIHCLNDQLTYRLKTDNKFKIYISALTQINIDEHNRIPTTDGRLLRRIVRDARTRGTDVHQTIAMWHSVRRGEENNIFPYQESADAVFNSTLIYEFAVMKIYAEPLLFSVKPDEPEYEEAHRLLKFLDYFLPIPADDIPKNSLIREFIGGN